MTLWLILSIVFCIIIFIITFPLFEKEERIHYLWIIPCAVIVAAFISSIASACAPNQYIPDEEIKFSQINCDSIVITPAFFSKDTIDTDKFNIDYKLQNNTATLSEEIPVYCCSFETSATGHPYIEKYFCRRVSSIREFLYGSWFRPRWYYKIYLVPTE
jgi:hypothetical protein